MRILIIVDILLGLIGTLLTIFPLLKRIAEDPIINRDYMLYKVSSQLSSKSSFTAKQLLDFEHYENNVWPHNKRMKRWFNIGVILLVISAVINIVTVILSQ